MSWWTEFRDGLETAAAIVVNYFYPGLGALGYYVNSEGSQEQLRSTFGQLAMLGSGGLGASAGNFANYGATADALGGGGEAFGAAQTPETFDYTSAWRNSGDTLGGMGEAAGTGAPDYGDLNYAGAEQSGNGLGQGPGPVGTAGGQANPYDNFGDLRGTGTQGQGNVFSATGAGTSGGSAGPFNAAGTTTNGNTIGAITNFNPASGRVAMPWSSPAGVANLGSSALGLLGSGYLTNQAAAAQAAADPFRQQRQQYADAMGRLAANPNSIYDMPGYKAGEQAVRRAMAAQGYTGSGNVLAALQKYGGDFYNQTMNMYGGLAGAQFNPAQAAQLGLGGRQAAVDLAGRSLGSLGYGSMMAGNQWPNFGG